MDSILKDVIDNFNRKYGRKLMLTFDKNVKYMYVYATINLINNKIYSEETIRKRTETFKKNRKLKKLEIYG